MPKPGSIMMKFVGILVRLASTVPARPGIVEWLGYAKPCKLMGCNVYARANELGRLSNNERPGSGCWPPI